MNIKGIIFDMDGVVTQTALLHFKTWKIVLDQFLYQLDPKKIEPFTQQEYYLYLDGMPRRDGIKNFLLAREIGLSALKQHYSNLEECINFLCENKNTLLLSIIAEENVQSFPDTIEFISYLLPLNYRIALITSSKNCQQILKSAEIEQLFFVRVDGNDADIKGFPGKPKPDIFLEAAKQLCLAPEECMVIEDAIAGIKAAKDGNFGLVVALDRENKLYKEFKKLAPDYILTDLFPHQFDFYKQFAQENIKLTAFAALPLIEMAMKNKKEIVLFLDYDGTLTPIVDRPQDVRLAETMRKNLVCLSKNYLTVIISGRQLDDLKQQVNIPTIFYAGNHGFEFDNIKTTDPVYQKKYIFINDINSIYQQLTQTLKEIPGCIIENKKFTLSIHYRLVAPDKLEMITNTIINLLSNYPTLALHGGKKVVEIRPNLTWNKGIAAENFLKWMHKNTPNYIPLFIGDDVTDEDAFQQFMANGITIKVGESLKTHAHYHLTSPEDVENFLVSLNNLRINNEPMDC